MIEAKHSEYSPLMPHDLQGFPCWPVGTGTISCLMWALGVLCHLPSRYSSHSWKYPELHGLPRLYLPSLDKTLPRGQSCSQIWSVCTQARGKQTRWWHIQSWLVQVSWGLDTVTRSFSMPLALFLPFSSSSIFFSTSLCQQKHTHPLTHTACIKFIGNKPIFISREKIEIIRQGLLQLLTTRLTK